MRTPSETPATSAQGSCSLARVKSYGALDELNGNAEVARLGQAGDGVLFLTFSLLVATAGSRRNAGRAGDPRASRYGQVLAWLRKRAATGGWLVCLDEAHKAKNLDVNAQAARLIEQLQRS